MQNSLCPDRHKSGLSKLGTRDTVALLHLAFNWMVSRVTEGDRDGRTQEEDSAAVFCIITSPIEDMY